jgi:hypothetical protein
MTSTLRNHDLPGVPAARGSFLRGVARCVVAALAILWCAAVSAQGDPSAARVPVESGPAVDAKILATGAVVSDVLAINQFAFEGRDATDSAVLGALGDERFCDGRACTMLAPVEPPSGTRVERRYRPSRNQPGDRAGADFQRRLRYRRYHPVVEHGSLAGRFRPARHQGMVSPL